MAAEAVTKTRTVKHRFVDGFAARVLTKEQKNDFLTVAAVRCRGELRSDRT